MGSPSTSDVLRNGLVHILDLWRDRLGGDGDLLEGVLRLQLGATPAATPEVTRAHDTIRAYYDNVRYALLDPLAMVWGTLTNGLRVAAQVASVTESQRRVFAFSAESLAAFFRAAHTDLRTAEALREAFKPMPAADCQTLAALFNPNLDQPLDGQLLVALVRIFGNEGPLTTEEKEALSVLESTGLIHAAFRGSRGRG